MHRLKTFGTGFLILSLTAMALPGGVWAQPQVALEVALSHLSANATALGLAAEDLADKAVTDQYRSENNGVTHIHLRQRLQGIEVANGTINVNVKTNGQELRVGNRLVGDLAGKVNSRRPELIAESAIRSAAEQSLEPPHRWREQQQLPLRQPAGG